VLVEHVMELVMALADQVTVLNFGKKICSGDPEAIRKNPQVIEAYLGHGSNA
jgi:ABC-type branched-subunit amino acid transport system ATPase component